MMQHKCPRCGYETHVLTNLKKHLSRKKPCESTYSQDDQNAILQTLPNKSTESLQGKYPCTFCGKEFATAQGKYQHKKHCKKKSEGNSEEKIIAMQEEIEKLKEVIKEIKPQNQIQMNNCTINTTVQNNVQQNNTITLENFGKENVEFLADSFIRRCLFRAPDGVTDLTKKIHFNPDKPEYHNVTTTNKKDGFLEVFKDGKWLYDDKNKVLDALIKQSFDIISSHYDQFDDEIKAELSPTNFKRVDRFVESVLNQDKTIQNSLRKCLYLLILNNRHMINKE
jgi:DNA-directed RNA polymerase subunit RPC12/RpoP